jgi:hypothetical protein
MRVGMAKTRAILLALLMVGATAPALPAMAQTSPAKPVDAVDALAAWRRLDVSRQAVKDQLELCNDDAARFQQIGRELKPGDGAAVDEWNDWGNLLRNTGLELQSCLRAYGKQIGLLRADHQALRELLPAARDAKRMSLGPKQLSDAGKAVDDAELEIASAQQKAVALAEVADQTWSEAQRLLRQAGAGKVGPLAPFRNLL